MVAAVGRSRCPARSHGDAGTPQHSPEAGCRAPRPSQSSLRHQLEFLFFGWPRSRGPRCGSPFSSVRLRPQNQGTLSLSSPRRFRRLSVFFCPVRVRRILLWTGRSKVSGAAVERWCPPRRRCRRLGWPMWLVLAGRPVCRCCVHPDFVHRDGRFATAHLNRPPVIQRQAISKFCIQQIQGAV